MRSWLATVGAIVILSPSAAISDHMNGGFFGVGEWSDYTLYLSQSGQSIEAEILQCDEPVIELDGFSDGGDLAQGEAFALGDGAEGTFMLRWSQGNVLVNMAFAGSSHQAAFGPRPAPNSCSGARDGGHDGWSNSHSHGPDDHTRDDARGGQAEGAGDGAVGAAEGSSPFPDY